MTALVLQASLAEKAGVPSPHVTPVLVEAYYKEHQSEYGQLPADPEQQQAAWEKIDLEIRLKLAKELEIEHMRKFKQFVENLKAGAKITVASPGE